MENAGFPIDANYMASLKYHPQVQVNEALWGQRIDWYREWITNTNQDDPYWQSGFWKLLQEIPGKIKIPIYIGEGWYDHHLGSALGTYEDLSPESKTHSVFRIEAWNHNFMPCVGYGLQQSPEQRSAHGICLIRYHPAKERITPGEDHHLPNRCRSLARATEFSSGLTHETCFQWRVPSKG